MSSSSGAFSSAATSSNCRFYEIGKNSIHFPTVESLLVEEGGGAEKAFLSKVKEGRSHKCELLFDRDKPVGLLVYKRDLQNKDASVRHGFEVKVCMLIQSDQESQRYDTLLVTRIKTLAQSLGADFAYFKLSSTASSIQQFLEVHGFSQVPRERKEGLPERTIMRLRIDSEKAGASSSGVQRVAEHTNGVGFKLKKRDKSSSETGEEKRIERKREREVELLDEERYPQKRRCFGQEGEGSFHGKTSRIERPPHSEHRSSKPHEVTLRAQYIHQIQQGSKTVEGRINAGMFRNFKVGDRVRFFYKQNERDDVICRIDRIELYRGFREMLQGCGVDKCLPEVRSLDEGVRIYHSIDGYEARAYMNGVVGIHITRE